MCKRMKYLLIMVLLGCLSVSPAYADGNPGNLLSNATGDPEGSPESVALVVASPRATLVSIPPSTNAAETHRCGDVGAATNFAISDLEVYLQQGTRLFLRLSDTIEGVWYDDTFGFLGTFIILDFWDDAVGEWVFLEYDGASAIRQGPSVGTAQNIHTVFNANELGDHFLRVRIATFGVPIGFGGTEYLYACGDEAYDAVYLTVHVIGSEDPVPTPLPEFDEPSEELPKGFN